MISLSLPESLRVVSLMAAVIVSLVCLVRELEYKFADSATENDPAPDSFAPVLTDVYPVAQPYNWARQGL